MFVRWRLAFLLFLIKHVKQSVNKCKRERMWNWFENKFQSNTKSRSRKLEVSERDDEWWNRKRRKGEHWPDDQMKKRRRRRTGKCVLAVDDVKSGAREKRVQGPTGDTIQLNYSLVKHTHCNGAMSQKYVAGQRKQRMDWWNRFNTRVSQPNVNISTKLKKMMMMKQWRWDGTVSGDSRHLKSAKANRKRQTEEKMRGDFDAKNEEESETVCSTSIRASRVITNQKQESEKRERKRWSRLDPKSKQ